MRMNENKDIINTLKEYQHRVYTKIGGKMRVKDIVFECRTCNVYFTPSIKAAKEQMEKKSVLNECRECYEDMP